MFSEAISIQSEIIDQPIEVIEEKEYKKLTFSVPALPKQRPEKICLIKSTDYLPQQVYSLPSKVIKHDDDNDDLNDSFYIDFLNSIETNLMEFVLIMVKNREKSLSCEFFVNDAIESKVELDQLSADVERLQVCVCSNL